MCVCFYDLAMPICIILDPLNWTRPDLIHIEGDRGRDRPRDPPCPPRQEAAGEGSSAVLESRAPAPRPECVAEKEPASCGNWWCTWRRRPGSAAGARDDHEPHQLYTYSLKATFHLPSNDISDHYT